MTKKKKPAAPWGNRIVGVGTVPAGELLGNEANFRIHPGAQQDALGTVLAEVGFVQSVIVNKRTSPEWGRDRHVETLVDGHLRAQMALSRGEDTQVPVTYVDLTPAEERRILATLDGIAALAGHDADKLDALLAGSVDDWPDSTLDLAKLLKRERKQLVSFEAETDRHNVLVECVTEEAQCALMDQLRTGGFTCRPTSRKA